MGLIAANVTGYAINTVLAGCSAALVADLLGFHPAGALLSASTLNSLFAGSSLLAGSLVLLSLLRLAGNLRPLSRLKDAGQGQGADRGLLLGSGAAVDRVH